MKYLFFLFLIYGVLQDSYKESLDLFHRFFEKKEAFFKASNKDTLIYHQNELIKTWDTIQEKRNTLFPLLLSMENDTSYSLYGNTFDSLQFILMKMPNNLHALYLMEAIIRNDYLFNGRRVFAFSRKHLLQDDAMNFLCDNSCNKYYKILPISIEDKIRKKYIKQAYRFYKEWYYAYPLRKTKYPLDNAPFKWHIEHGNIYDIERWNRLNRKYNFDNFMIGNGISKEILYK